MNAIHAASLAEVGAPDNPFPGLRPFELNESHLFFGRDGQVERLIGKMARSRFVAVVGASGSGKSSLMRAGVLPALFGGLMGGTSSYWQVAILRPGDAPIANLALALDAVGLFGAGSRQEATLQAAMVEAGLRRGGRGLVEAARHGGIAGPRNLLVLVDQFEEIFRFARVAEGQKDANEAAAFVKLLLEAARQRELPIYVALTMRSDYLGDCARFWGLPEAINESQYLMPRLTREELRRVIAGPIAVGGGRISDRLLNRLLNEFGGDQDQLPILQHALMRTWEEMRTWEKWKEDVHAGPVGLVDTVHYEATGGMAQALSRHADEAFNSLPGDRSRQIAERLFKALTEKGPDNREIRRPNTLADLCAVAVAEETEVVEVIEAFRQPARSFLMPPVPAHLLHDSLIDVSHESLIRRWERLRNWVEEESESAKIYVRLAETAELHKSGKAALWQDPDLRYALEWKDRMQPNAAWAARYHPGFAAAVDFLERSRCAREEALLHERQGLEREIAHQLELLEQADARANAERQLREEAERRTKAEVKAAEQARRAAMRLSGLAIALAVVLVIAPAAAQFAIHQKVIAESRALAAQAEQALGHDQPAALSLAIRGWHTKKTLEAGLAIADSFPQLLATLQGHTEAVVSAVFSPDGQRIVTASADYTARVWNASSGQLLATLQGHTGAVTRVVFSPDGQRIVTASADHTARVWNASSGQLLATLQGHTDAVRSAVYSPDGQRILTASGDYTARVWNANNVQLLATLQGHTDAVNSAVFSPDGQRILTTSKDHTARVWNANSGRLLATLQGHSAAVVSAVFSPDGQRILTASWDHTARVWNAGRGQPLAILQGDTDRVESAVFSPDGQRIVTASVDHTARVWNAGGQLLATLQGHSEIVASAVFSPDGQRIVTASADHTARVWNAGGGQLLATLQGHSGAVAGAAFSSDGQRIVTASGDHTARVWNANSGQLLAALQGHSDAVGSAVYSPDGQRIVTASGDHTARVWNANSGQLLATLQGHTSVFNSAVYSPDGQRIVTASSDHTARVWNASGGQLLATLQGHTDAVRSAVYSPDGQRILTASDDHTARVWNAGDGRLLAALQGHTGAVASAVFSADGQRIVTASMDRTARVWNANSGQLLATLKGHSAAVVNAVFSPDGQRIATASVDHTARVWSAGRWETLAVLQGHIGYVVSAAFSPDGQRILTGSWDHTARVWSADRGELLSVLQGHSDSVRSAVFSPDGQRILTASDDHTARVFQLVTLSEIADLLAK